MLLITGAAGFIGSCLVSKLNNKGYRDLVISDDFTRAGKQKNWEKKAYREKVDRKALFDWLESHPHDIDFIFHIGARTDTTEFDWKVFEELNLDYSRKIWNFCTDYRIPLIYASSAATYGDGKLGYDDDPRLIPLLKPLNPYGISKNEFDKWVLTQEHQPPCWYGLKFFNVYGPNEYHKGRMASVIFHAFNQVRDTGQVKLFRSHHPAYRDGEQLRDFIYVKDVVEVMLWLMNHRNDPGIYNLGTGKARTFLDLATAVFSSLDRVPEIRFIDTPADIRDRYQYFTEANMQKLRAAGYSRPFVTLEQGIEEYVQGYLLERNFF